MIISCLAEVIQVYLRTSVILDGTEIPSLSGVRYSFISVGDEEGKGTLTNLVSGESYTKNFWTTDNFGHKGSTGIFVAIKGDNTPDSGLARMKIYSFAARDYTNNIDLCDIVPCLDTANVPCLYDRIRKMTFYQKGGNDLKYEIL